VSRLLTPLLSRASASGGTPRPPFRSRQGARAAFVALVALSSARPAAADQEPARSAAAVSPPARVAAAAPPPSQVAAAALPPALRPLEAGLRSRDHETLNAALGAIVRLGAAARPLRPAVEALAESGLSPPLARTALEALGAMGVRESAPVLRRYLRHRRADLRLAAARALSRVGGPVAVAALRPALDDREPLVRGEAASALASLGAVEAVDDLYRALDRGVPEAAPALGRLCLGRACAGIADRLSQQPFAVLAPGCEALLFRPAAEVPDAQKIALVRRLRELPLPEVHRSLADWRARWTGSPAVGEALARAAEATAPPRRD
jgi:HEAT repeat protein